MWAITLPTKIKNAFKSIRLKFILAYLLITLIAFCALGAAMTRLVGDYVFTRAGSEKLDLTELVCMDLSESSGQDAGRGLYEACALLGERYGARAIAISPEGSVIADSDSAMNGYEYSLKPLFSQYGESDSAYALVKSADAAPLSIEGESRLILCYKLMPGGTVLTAAFPAGEVYEGFAKALGALLLCALAILVLCALLGLLITGSFTRPIKALRSAIARLSQGDFSVRAEEVGNNELTDLSRAFNDMAGKMELLDRSRNQFVSNASHELKTPLAGMKILVECVRDQKTYDPVMAKDFLNDVDTEIDRLSRIVADLLTLVGLDTGNTKLNLVALNLDQLAQESVKRLSPLARERGVELDIEVHDSVSVNGDRLKLEQVLYNLIDNAIKYSPRGESVLVEVFRRGANAVVSVKDTGIGIPRDDIDHIFDRFYRVDKARSRETGGTGLGLSIVRQIILVHGGNITVESEEDKGSVFTVSLPLARVAEGRHE